MLRRRAYPSGMDRDRLIALVCDVALEQGGDWDAVGVQPLSEDPADGVPVATLFEGDVADEGDQPVAVHA